MGRKDKRKRNLTDALQDIEIGGLRYMSEHLPRHVILLDTYKSFRKRYSSKHAHKYKTMTCHNQILQYAHRERKVLKRYVDIYFKGK